MASKKLPKNIDLASTVDVAAGFFSKTAPSEGEASPKSKLVSTSQDIKTTSVSNTVPPKKIGGRPKKDGLKNQPFTLTMNPEMYEKVRIIATEYTRGNFSGLIDEAIKSFCREHSIDLSTVHVPPEILERYKEKQRKK